METRLLIGVELVLGNGPALAVYNDAGPFGGMKRSGLGGELGQEGLDAFQETKHLHIETRLEVKDR
jgi:acyl-CoA reductase-like NAD-dependent aldehyde dehydrogenase